MTDRDAGGDTARFEVAASLDPGGRLTGDCARRAVATMDAHGFVILTGLLSDAEADTGLALIRETIADPDRARGAFASETDNRYARRDFCALPTTPAVTGFAAMLCRRVAGVLAEYCGPSRPVLEIATLTSYLGSSHQYIHRDPPGVISLFAAVEDVSDDQGGTVFVPGSHDFGGAADTRPAGIDRLTRLFQLRCNARIFRQNWRMLRTMRARPGGALAPGEFRDRTFSGKWDQHQPNLLRFLLGKNALFSLRMIGPRTLWALYRQRDTLDRLYHVVRTAPRKGTVILYRSDLLHAGPDNRSDRPRRLFSLSIARDVVGPKFWTDGYSPHPTLQARPLCLADLLAPVES